MRLEVDKTKPNMTPKGTIPHTWFAICSCIPKCAECGVGIPEYDNAFFCFASKKLFCWDCMSQDGFVCSKHYRGIKEHSDRVVKIKVEENAVHG